MPRKPAARRSSTTGGRPARSSGARTGRRGSGGTGNGVLAFLLGAAIAVGAAYLYLHSTPRPPAAPAPATTSASQPTPPVPHAKPPQPPAPVVRSAPFGTSEDVFEAGAHLFSAHCAGCHGTPAKDVSVTPPAHQFWRKGRHEVAARAPGDLYSEIAAGAPSSGMPAFAHTLTDTQIWQLALLLKSADQDLPDPVDRILRTPPHP